MRCFKLCHFMFVQMLCFFSDVQSNMSFFNKSLLSIMFLCVLPSISFYFLAKKNYNLALFNEASFIASSMFMQG